MCVREGEELNAVDVLECTRYNIFMLDKLVLNYNAQCFTTTTELHK